MPYLFVGGCQRTGTSLLQSMLCSDEKANPFISEIEYLRFLVQAYCIGRNGFDFSLQYYFSDKKAFRDFHGAWIKTFLGEVLSRYSPAEYLVLKEPHLTVFFPDLWELINEARFIVMVRDPRDTICSLMEVREKLKEKGSSHVLTQADVFKLIKLYQSFYMPCVRSKSQNFNKNVKYIKYENLVTTPEQVIEELRQFSGLRLNSLDINNPWRRSVKPIEEAHVRELPWRTDLYGKGIESGSVGRYKRDLTTDQIQQVEEGCKEFYRLFDYPLS